MEFRPAKHCALIIWIGQMGNALDLAWRARLRLDPLNLEVLKTIPRDAGLIVAANHSDEMDIKVCMELARRSRRRFTYMINAEAFDECRGIAGWWLQRLGSFSVEKGGGDRTARRYAVDVVKKQNEALVIFPEGEIQYLNDLVQPFKTGAAHTGLQAIAEARRERPGWTAYILPVAIKYRYRKTIRSALAKKIRRMEKHLSLRADYFTFQKKLIGIMAEVLKRRELLDRLQMVSGQLAKLKEQVEDVRAEILSKIESKYLRVEKDPKKRPSDRAQKLIFFLRECLKQKKLFSPETRRQLQKDLKGLKQTIQMAGWQPQYIDLDPSEERLAETVMKLEREVFQKKRPRALGYRDVFMRIGEPVDLGGYLNLYKENPSLISNKIAEGLRDNIQALVEKV